MQHPRTVWVVADSAGRQLLRASASRRAFELAGSLVGLLLVGLVAGCVHAVTLHVAGGAVSSLAAEVVRMRGLAKVRAEQLAALTALTESNHAALVQLEHKSGFTFVSLAEKKLAQTDQSKLQVTLALPDEALARGTRLQTALGDLLEYWHDAERRLANTPAVRPARTAWLSSSFGVRSDPMSHRTVMHKGLDMAGQLGMTVYAPADGRVIWTGERGGYGQVVVLDHGWGLQTHYAHLSKYLVAAGKRVQRGEPIAQMGNTGKSTGPHLHYEVRQDGLPIDPRHFILD